MTVGSISAVTKSARVYSVIAGCLRELHMLVLFELLIAT
jgi:hypothetical protein